MVTDSSQPHAKSILDVVAGAATGIEVLAVAIIVSVIAIGTVMYVFRFRSQGPNRRTYDDYRHQVGRALLLGLEILVAADIIRTVALESTLANIAGLGLLVLIRTFLSWSLSLEMDGHWPWQSTPGDSARGNEEGI